MRITRILLIGIRKAACSAALLGIATNVYGEADHPHSMIGQIAASLERQASSHLEIAPATKPSPLLPIITDARQPIGTRIKAVRDLGDNLSLDDVQALYFFLTSLPNWDEKNLPGLRVIKNDILNRLQLQATAPVGLTLVMLEMYRNPSQDMVVRDYALQHLAIQGQRDDGGEIVETQRGLLEAAQGGGPLAGTALLGLHRLSTTESNKQDEQIDAIALNLAKSSASPLSTRITALQVCSERRLLAVLPEAEKLARSDGPAALRISAISVLGQLGKTHEITLLRNLRLQGSALIRAAASTALERAESGLANREPLSLR